MNIAREGEEGIKPKPEAIVAYTNNAVNGYFLKQERNRILTACERNGFNSRKLLDGRETGPSAMFKVQSRIGG